MPNEKKLIFRLEAQNAAYLKKIEQSERKIKDLEMVAGRSIASIRNDFARSSSGMSKFGQAANSAGKASSRMGWRMSQLGHQIQDVSVQLQAGTEKMIILGQQGPQIASILGPGGPLIGAMLAVGAVAVGTLAPSLLTAGDSAGKLKKSLEELEDTLKRTEDGTLLLTKGFERLAAKSRDLAEVQLKARLISATVAAKAAFDLFKDSSDSLNITLAKSGNAVRGNENRINRLAKQYGITKKELMGLRELLQVAFKSQSERDVKALRDAVAGLAITAGKGNDKFVQLADKIQQSSDKFLQQRESIAFLKGALSDINGALAESGESFAELSEDIDKAEAKLQSFFDQQNAARDRRQEGARTGLEGLRAQLDEEYAIELQAAQRKRTLRVAMNEDLIKDKQKFAELEVAIETAKNEALEQLEKTRIRSQMNFWSSSLATIQQGLDERSTLAKIAFAAEKAIAIAEMIMNTENAAVAALQAGGPYFGPVLAGITRGLGYAAVGIVAGQTIASFDGGGLTGSGPRSGGLDGRGGRLAIMHPNEKVIDLTRESANDGGGWNVNVHNYNGGNPQVQLDERQRTIDIMIEQAGNQGSRFRQALHSTSNLQPRGNR